MRRRRFSLLSRALRVSAPAGCFVTAFAIAITATPILQPLHLSFTLPLQAQELDSDSELPRTLSVGSKQFTESYVLGEIMAQLLEDRGFRVKRRHNLGGTLICYEALRTGEIDLYPEYTGTIREAILKAGDSPSPEAASDINAGLRAEGLIALSSFGFNNTYAFVVRRDQADELGLRRLSDLQRHPDLRLALSYEFLDRGDGWRPLKQAYALPQDARGIQHGLAYRALAEAQIDVTDAYSTDAEIQRYDLRVLADDRGFFPEYLAVPLVRRDLPPAAREALGDLAGVLDEARMQALNARVSVERLPFEQVAAEFLREARLLQTNGAGVAGHSIESGESRVARIFDRLLRHIWLTAAAVFAAALLAVPLGLFAYNRERVARPLLYLAGLLQTIPSIALLAFMIPLFGIGVLPAIVGLLLYAILPILRTTVTALRSVDPQLVEVATGLGLPRAQVLRRIELPLALPGMIAGLRVAVVIAIGTATLAAFIGAGGLGEPIVTGLALNDPVLILEGALPAASLAILADIAFDLLERKTVPAFLR